MKYAMQKNIEWLIEKISRRRKTKPIPACDLQPSPQRFSSLHAFYPFQHPSRLIEFETKDGRIIQSPRDHPPPALTNATPSSSPVTFEARNTMRYESYVLSFHFSPTFTPKKLSNYSLFLVPRGKIPPLLIGTPTKLPNCHTYFFISDCSGKEHLRKARS